MIIENDMGQYKFSLFFHIDFPGQNKVMSLKTDLHLQQVEKPPLPWPQATWATCWRIWTPDSRRPC